MGKDFEIVTRPIYLGVNTVHIMKRSVIGNFKITPRFIPDGWRVLRPREKVEEGDYRWKKVARVRNGGYYIPAIKNGEITGYPITYIRRV